MVNLNTTSGSRWYKGDTCSECGKPVSIVSTGLCKSCSHKGDRCNFWRGENLGYHGVHKWLRKYFGKATYCENEACTKKSNVYQWAKIKGERYERKRENFIQLCRSCHNKYDFTEISRKRMSISATNKDRSYQLKPIIQVGEDFTRLWESATAAARYFKTTNSNIAQVLSGKHKTAVGYKWRYAKGGECQ